MSGWIKIEKDLVSEPRFRRMAKALASDVTQVRITPENAATQVLGGLVQLWIYADTHIREDDTLDIGPDEIDELIGIAGFAELMPVDWLEVLDTHCVKLPGFQEHNGTDAKRKAQTAKRVARHRIRNVTQQSSNSVTSSNADALPDQTRPDQTRPEKKPPNPQGGKGEKFDPESVAGLDHHAWRDWVQYRAARKPALKPASMAAAAKAMAALGTGQRAAVDHSIANGYQGLIPPKGTTNGNGYRPTFEQLDQQLAALAGDGPLLAGDATPVRPALEPELRRKALAVVGGGN